MNVIEWMQPRDPGVATRLVGTLVAVSVVVPVAVLPLVREEVDRSRAELVALSAMALTCVVLVAGARLFTRGATRLRASRLAWTLCPFLAVGAIVTIDLATFDASLAAQIFFLFPALYGGTLLPRAGALLVTAGTLVGEVLVVTANLPAREAVVDAGYMSAALLTTTFALSQASERETRLRRELEQRAATDSLTGLVNRRAFDTAVSDALGVPGGDGTALVLIDIDLFKSINDRYGHPGGDQILVELSTLLTRASRAGDVVCRLGGDELAVLMPGCTLRVAQRRAEEMVETVREHGFAAGVQQVREVSISAGLAHVPTNAVDASGLYAAADQALYAAKRDGRDRVAFHSG